MLLLLLAASLPALARARVLEPDVLDRDDASGYRQLNISYVGASEPPGGGMFIEISEDGMDYVAAMTTHALPRLLTGLPFPSLEGAGFSVSKLQIKGSSSALHYSVTMKPAGI